MARSLRQTQRRDAQANCVCVSRLDDLVGDLFAGRKSLHVAQIDEDAGQDRPFGNVLIPIWLPLVMYL